MPGVQDKAPQGSERSLQPESRRDKATRRYGNHRDAKRLWTACKTRDSGPRCVKQESPGFCLGRFNELALDSQKRMLGTASFAFPRLSNVHPRTGGLRF